MYIAGTCMLNDLAATWWFRVGTVPPAFYYRSLQTQGAWMQPSVLLLLWQAYRKGGIRPAPH